jgi:PleD family two-component response regulator
MMAHDENPTMVLVVDDNRDAAMALGLLLGAAGYKVETAFDPRPRCNRLSSSSPTPACLTSACPAWRATSWPSGCGSRALRTRRCWPR